MLIKPARACPAPLPRGRRGQCCCCALAGRSDLMHPARSWAQPTGGRGAHRGDRRERADRRPGRGVAGRCATAPGRRAIPSLAVAGAVATERQRASRRLCRPAGSRRRVARCRHGCSVSIARASIYSEFFAGFLTRARAGGQLRLPAADGRISLAPTHPDPPEPAFSILNVSRLPARAWGAGTRRRRPLPGGGGRSMR